MNSVLTFLVIPLVFWTSEDTDVTRAGHSWITRQAIEIVANDTSTLDVPQLKEDLTQLENLVNGPDKEETTYLTWVGHFYDPDTGLNYWGVNYNTALTNFIYHAENSVNQENQEWIKSLAYSLHYLQDACSPHHAGNYTALNTNHIAFEHYAQSIQEKFKVQKNIYEYRRVSNLEIDLTQILRNCSIRSKGWAKQIVDSDESSTIWPQAAEYTTKEVQYESALALARILAERFSHVR